MSSFSDRIIRRLVRRRAGALTSPLGLPRPSDEPRAHAPGIDPDRLLVFGNGAAVGWGVRSHDQALTGQLAQRLRVLTGRGVDVEATADPSVTVRTAAAALPTGVLSTFDGIVVVLGVSDALRRTSARRWRRGLLDLFDGLTAGARPDAEVLVVGIGRPSSLATFSVEEGGTEDRHAALLDRVTRELCDARERTHFVSLSEPDPEEHAGGAGVVSDDTRARRRFARGADELAQVLAPLLDHHVESGRIPRPARDGRQSDEIRLAAIHALGLLDSPPEKRFDDITERARILLGTSGAAFSIVDEDRLYNKSFSGAGVVEVPLRGAMCAVTIESGKPFVVPDVWHDERFVTHPSVRFYAGHPVETPDGVRIGALCVTDPRPRGADSIDLVLLRELALSVQRELAVPVIASAAAA